MSRGQRTESEEELWCIGWGLTRSLEGRQHPGCWTFLNFMRIARLRRKLDKGFSVGRGRLNWELCLYFEPSCQAVTAEGPPTAPGKEGCPVPWVFVEV